MQKLTRFSDSDVEVVNGNLVAIANCIFADDRDKVPNWNKPENVLEDWIAGWCNADNRMQGAEKVYIQNLSAL